MNFIDLGLPSGTLWADCNVGAEKPEDNGEYFSFDDAKKHVTLPTREQWDELNQHCKLLWDLKEKRLEIVGPNGNKIILPPAGYCIGKSFFDVGSNGCYWSNTASSSVSFACYANFNTTHFDSQYTLYRNFGFTLRLVKNKD